MSLNRIAASARDRVFAWLSAEPHPVTPLPGRPPETLGPAHTFATTQTVGPAGLSTDAVTRAVCCSGGGIRAAAFALGGIQGLSRRRADGRRTWFDGLDVITAVSGGSYLAGSYALVRHSLPAGPGTTPAYAPGSPEDNRLRTRTRYLIEDPKVAAIGVLNILYGLMINLLPLLAGLYVVATLLGWLLKRWGLLVRDGAGWAVGDFTVAFVVVNVLAVAGLAVFSLERLCDVYRPTSESRSRVLRAWTLRLLGPAVLALVLLVGAPVLLVALAGPTWLDDRSVGLPPQLAGLGATTLAIVGAVKATLGRFRGRLQTSSQSGHAAALPGLLGRAFRWVAPWAGSVLCVLLLTAAFLSWLGNAAYTGPNTRQVGLLMLALVGMLAWQVVFDVNRNSIHSFYRERLSSAFFAVRRAKDGIELTELDYAIPLWLSDLENDEPALVICAAVNTDQEGVVPSGRGCAPFTFSARWCGISSGTMFQGEKGLAVAPPGMMATRDYQLTAGPALVTLPGAVAVSGAAVSPAMGRLTQAPLRLLLGLANVRLGLWLPNPSTAEPSPPDGTGQGEFPPPRMGVLDTMRGQLRQPGMRALLAELLGRTRLDGRWVYVTDGGHYENLGLVEALRRGATQIVVFDASGDPPNTWLAFGEAVQTARADLGVEIELDPSSMRPSGGQTGAPTLVVHGTCTYPDQTVADLYLCKLAMPAKASWDIHAWAGRNPNFPNDSTLQQLYGDREFEAYRRLGEIAAQHARTMLEDSALEDSAVEDSAVDLTRAGENGPRRRAATPPAVPESRSTP